VIAALAVSAREFLKRGEIAGELEAASLDPVDDLVAAPVEFVQIAAFWLKLDTVFRFVEVNVMVNMGLS